MNLWIRVLIVGILAFFRRKLHPTDISTTTFRVMPHDVDINIHLNNGRYLEIMDLGRLDMTIRMGLFSVFYLQHLTPVVVSSMIRYRRSLRLFQKYNVITKILGFNDRFIYIQQDFISNGELCARGAIKACLIQNGKMAHPGSIVDKFKIDIKSDLPQWLTDWDSANSALINHDRTSKP